jgi:serine/threonine protein phosphatase PrpC
VETGKGISLNNKTQLLNTMQITHITDKGSSEVNDDRYLVGKNIFAVFDGATAILNNYKGPDGTTTAGLAAEIAKNAFAKEDKPLKELALVATKTIRKAMEEKETDLSDKAKLWSTTVAAIQLKESTFEWIQIGDSPILIIYKDESHKILFEEYDHDKELLTKWSKLAKEGEKEMFKILKEECAQLRRQANVTYGFLNGEDDLKEFIECGEEPLENIQHILLLTDGLIYPKENLQNKDDFKPIVEAFLKGGINNIKKTVRDIENNDPECVKYPRFKKHDDATVIAITFD